MNGRDGLPGLPAPPIQLLVEGPRGDPGVQGPRGYPGPMSGGVVYTRWGKSSCPDVFGTELVYAGRSGGSSYSHQGGGANYLCMPLNPEYTLKYVIGHQGRSTVYGSEYNNPITGTADHDVPCAVCSVTTRLQVLMIPAKTSCPTAWTREYYGYLMSEHYSHHRTMFVCVDKDQDSVPGSQAATYGAKFHHTEADCSGMPCPPYNNQKELNCVVCTK